MIFSKGNQSHCDFSEIDESSGNTVESCLELRIVPIDHGFITPLFTCDNVPEIPHTIFPFMEKQLNRRHFSQKGVLCVFSVFILCAEGNSPITTSDYLACLISSQENTENACLTDHISEYLIVLLSHPFRYSFLSLIYLILLG